MRYKHSAALKSKGIRPKLGHGSCGLAAFLRRHARYPQRHVIRVDCFLLQHGYLMLESCDEANVKDLRSCHSCD